MKKNYSKLFFINILFILITHSTTGQNLNFSFKYSPSFKYNTLDKDISFSYLSLNAECYFKNRYSTFINIDFIPSNKQKEDIFLKNLLTSSVNSTIDFNKLHYRYSFELKGVNEFGIKYFLSKNNDFQGFYISPSIALNQIKEIEKEYNIGENHVKTTTNFNLIPAGLFSLGIQYHYKSKYVIDYRMGTMLFKSYKSIYDSKKSIIPTYFFNLGLGYKFHK